MNQRTVRIPSDVMEIHPNLFVLEVDMDSMAPTVRPGDYIAVDSDTQPPRDGSEMGVVEVGGTLYLCRPMQLMGQVVMNFDHPDVQSITLPASIARVVGAVVWTSFQSHSAVAG